MFAELLTADQSGPMKDLLLAYPFKPFGWAPNQQSESAVVEYLRSQIAHTVNSGGIVKTYLLGGKVVGMCAAEPDEWASRELGRRACRIDHLMALGQPEAQLLIKTLVLQETMRAIPERTVVVADMNYTDLTSINALERVGFTATQTSLRLARDLAAAECEVAGGGDYEIEPVAEGDVDLVLRGVPVEMPRGFLGWDSRLPHGSAVRVHQDWLKTYAHERSLLMARDRGRPVGVLAEHVRKDTTPYLGFAVGSIDLVATIPEYRNNGVAGRLVTRSLAEFRSLGARLAELRVHSADTPAAQHYQSQGFVTVGSSLMLASWRH
jgi:GNAT superfamily N-acetyltransferase